MSTQLDLLTPQGPEDDRRQNYIHQLRQTINAYDPTNVFVGEALQNALDAVRQAGTRKGGHEIEITMDFPARKVTVSDTGAGFPDDPSLLFLGGGKKKGQGLAGMVGVGLKVALFSTSSFQLRAMRDDSTSTRVDIDQAYRFDQDDAELAITVADEGHRLPSDPQPLVEPGTVVEYSFPEDESEATEGVPERYLRDVLADCGSTSKPDFITFSLPHATASAGPGIDPPFPNRLSALIVSHLRRFTYIGSTSHANEFDNLKVSLRIVSDEASLGDLAEFADGKHDVTVPVTPKYFTVSDSLKWPHSPKPVVVATPLGDGGENLTRAASQINVTTYTRPDEFEQLVTNKRGRPAKDLEDYKRLLFPRIRSITLTIGRIDPLKIYLPGGPRRVISARGVATQHDIDVYSGQNQQYVRAFDIVIDVDADLNYGKTHLTNRHLVGSVRSFLNDAYRDTIQNAARNLVGKLKTDEPTEEKFWDRPDLDSDDFRIKKVPRDENDVIALLFELVGKGHFPEFDWYGLSQRDTYDARAYFRDHGAPPQASSAHDLKVIEFKLHGASVARDFDTADDKDIARVDLVICYQIGESPIATYQVVDLQDSTLGQSDNTIYPGVTHVLFDTRSGKEVQLLPLREYIADEFPPADPEPMEADVIDDES